MNKKMRIIFVGLALAVLFLGFLIGRYLMPSHGGTDSGSNLSAVPAEVMSVSTVWTCSMHPQIQQSEPGDCPICGMDLIPLFKNDNTEDGPRTMSMSESAKALADIQTVLVSEEFPEVEVRMVGKLGYDETRVKSLTARFAARIDELYVNYSGVQVKKGEHLARVYSPDLLTAQRELLTAYRSDPTSSITRAAREKLRLWDLLPGQIDTIIQEGEARDHFVLRSPVEGVVVTKNVKEGDYITTGQALFKIVDLSRLWLILDAYESDLVWLRYGQSVEFTVESYPGEIFTGKIAFLEPEVDSRTRTIPVRINVPNQDGRLKPGMFVRGVVMAKVAKGGKVFAPEFSGKWISPMHPEIVKDAPGECDVCGMDLVPAEELGYVYEIDESAPLVIPVSAVLRTGKRAVVYVEKPNVDRPVYEGREVVLGPRAGEFFIVAEGLKAGERVVTNGAFKIDSALQIQAKPSMMNPPENREPASSQVKAATAGGVLKISPQEAVEVLPFYLRLQSALSGDDSMVAKVAAKDMMAVSGHAESLAKLLHRMLDAKSLDALRKPYFETLSDALIIAVQANPSLFDMDLFQMHCPMVYEDRGASWIQSKKALLNPYFGNAMLHCGEVKGKLN